VEFAPADLSAIPVRQLVHRRLRLGPFASGRDLVKFLCFATVGAAVAAVTSAVVWLPFLAAGGMIAFLRVEGQSLDEYALGYVRFRRRASGSTGRLAKTDRSGPRSPGPRRKASPTLRAGGIPIAYLPPADLQRVFAEWRSALSAVDGSVGFRARGELFSPLPFLPASQSPHGAEREALDSYRDMVRGLLRQRYRRVVDVKVGTHGPDGELAALHLQTRLDGLLVTLERLGISAQRSPVDPVTPMAGAGGIP
jgi:hypothetical protein